MPSIRRGSCAVTGEMKMSDGQCHGTTYLTCREYQDRHQHHGNYISISAEYSWCVNLQALNNIPEPRPR